MAHATAIQAIAEDVDSLPSIKQEIKNPKATLEGNLSKRLTSVYKSGPVEGLDKGQQSDSASR